MISTFKSLLADESGATAIEYGLIAALVSVACVAALGLVGDGLNEVFGEVEAKLTGAAEGGEGG